MRLEDSSDGGFMVHNNSESSLIVEVKSNQQINKSLMEFKESVFGKLNDTFSLGEDGIIRFHGGLCIPSVDGLRDRIIEEDHGSRYSIHLSSTKIYHDLRKVF